MRCFGAADPEIEAMLAKMSLADKAIVNKNLNGLYVFEPAY